MDAAALVEKHKDDEDAYKKLEVTLLGIDPTTTLAERFRALFTLKSLKTPKAVEIISKAFSDDSALLKHELAYVLGQMGLLSAIPVLNRVLADKSQDSMVRHEAAEALGAIGAKESLDILREFLNDEQVVVRETCELAIERINMNPISVTSAYASVDPAPPLEEETDVQKIRAVYLDPSKSLFIRYRAMFSLRNIGTKEAIEILAEGFCDESALFRHEVAFVFGQMQRKESVDALIKVLNRPGEEAMVRHEAAEALGSIATEECHKVLEKFKVDNERVVQESCQVALDMLRYETSNEFHYGVLLE